jgi:hypothetical protein
VVQDVGGVGDQGKRQALGGVMSERPGPNLEIYVYILGYRYLEKCHSAILLVLFCILASVAARSFENSKIKIVFCMNNTKPEN